MLKSFDGSIIKERTDRRPCTFSTDTEDTYTYRVGAVSVLGANKFLLILAVVRYKVIQSIITARCYTERGYATVMSVCPSVMFRYCDHIG